MKTLLSVRVLAFASACLSIAAGGVAAEVRPAVTFRPVGFEAATQAAQQEHKLVLIDFFTTWCEPCKRLDTQTWTDAAVGKLLDEKAVALKLDAEKEGKDAAKRYKIDAYPTILVLKADGTEVDRHVGFIEPQPFTAEFNKFVALAAAGRTGLDMAKEQVAQQPKPAASEGEPEEAQPHFDLARKLIAAGKPEEALKELIWCWDEGKKDPEFARTRSTNVARELGRVARNVPAAREAMIVRRDQARERALANKGGSVVVQDLISLNKELKQDDDTAAVFDQMPAGDRRKVTISIYLFDWFLEKQRYADAVLFNMPESFSMQIEQAKARAKKGGTDEATAAFVRYTITNIAKRIEALAGAGQLDQARDLQQRLLDFDSSDATKELLRTHLTRAGHPELFVAEAAVAPKV